MSRRHYSRAVWAWALYDWANSAFILTIATAFFPKFFKGFWCAQAEASTIRLGYGNMLAGVIVALLSPVFGALAGAGKAKKQYLVIFMLLGATAAASLFWVGQGQWLAALILFIVGRMGFSLANLFYDSLLTDIAGPEETDMVSSLGFSIGYLGCGLFFAFNVLMFLKPAWFGLADEVQAVRVTFLLTGLWWVLFSIPLMLRVHQQQAQVKLPPLAVIAASLEELKITARAIVKNKAMVLFLAAYWFYIDGVHTVYLMATDFGLTLKFPFGVLMAALLAVQFVAFVFAYIFGLLATKIGTRPAILAAIGIYIFITLGGAWILRTPAHFVFFAAVTGLAQGAIQALSRSYFIRMVPPDRSAQYVGFYNMVGKFSLVLGPGIVATANLAGRSVGFDAITSSRFGISTLSVLFVAGAVLFLRVKPENVRQD